jgi:hypothetical protein
VPCLSLPNRVLHVKRKNIQQADLSLFLDGLREFQEGAYEVNAGMWLEIYENFDGGSFNP